MDIPHRLLIAYGLLALLVMGIVGAIVWVRFYSDEQITQRRRKREAERRAKR